MGLYDPFGTQQQNQHAFNWQQGQQQQPAPQVKPPSIGGNANNPYSTMNTNDPNFAGSSEMRNAIGDWRYMPSQVGQLQQTPNPWATNQGGAQGYLGGVFGQQNPMAQWGQNFLQQNSGMGGPQMPQAPNAQPLQSGQTQYQNPQGPGFQQPQFDQNRLGGFNPTSVRGPNVGQYGVDYGGPNASMPGFNDLVGLAQNMNRGVGQGLNLPRENLQGSGFQNQQIFGNPNSIANQAYGSALGASQGLANTDVNSSGLLQSLKDAQTSAYANAAKTGMEAAGSRGFSDPGGSVAGGEMGTRLGQAAAQSAADTQKALMDANQQQIGARTAGAGQLGQLGGSAAGAAQGFGNLLQGEQQGLNQGGIAQRGQDVNLAQTMAQLQQSGMNNNLQGLAGLVNAYGGTQADLYNAGSTRGLGQQGLAQQGALSGYNEQTNRMGTLGGLQNQANQNQTAQYGADTTRGLGVGGLQQQANDTGLGYGQLGLGYQQLGSSNQNQFNQAQNQFNQNQNQQYQIGGDQANSAYQNQTGRMGTLLGGAQGFGQLNQQQQQQLSGVAQGILAGNSQALQFQADLEQRAAAGDQQAMQQFVALKTQQELARWAQNQQNGSSITGGILSGLGGIAGGLFSGGGSTPTGGGTIMQGPPSPQYQYPG